jgi:hypothetical protein
MLSHLEKEAIDGLLLLSSKPTAKKTKYEVQCASLKKAREIRRIKLAERKKK